MDTHIHTEAPRTTIEEKTKTKNLSNPISTGGGGPHFEAHVQASFVVLMLTGGYAPCLPCWPITEIKLQGKIEGFDTDDVIVFVEDRSSKERRKLLGQIKRSISIRPSDDELRDVMQAAWNDFNNPNVFTRNMDSIALITGPLSAIDANSVLWLLNHAKHTKNEVEFFRNVKQANFSPPKSVEKLNVIRAHLEAANGGCGISDAEFYCFLKHYYILGYDLGSEYGVVLSLLHSHISQFQQQFPAWIWSRIVDIVQTWNHNGGTITPEGISDYDILEVFKRKPLAEIPEKFEEKRAKSETDWARHPEAKYLALAILIGSWEEKNENDIGVITQLLGIDYDTWFHKAGVLLHCPDHPLSVNNGVWKVNNRTKLWNLLGSQIFDKNLDMFKERAISVLSEVDPAFELPPEERYTACFYGKIQTHSHTLRKGIAEGLAILGSQAEACVNCSPGKAEATCALTVRELLSSADWKVWGSLNDLLPILAEAAPGVFLALVENTMKLDPNPIAVLFSQETSGITGRNYLAGLLWALEGLAWDEQYFVRSCVALAGLASQDPGGQSGNRPSDSLVTILLPWLPQTLASADKRMVAVKTMLEEYRDVSGDVLIQLLPGQNKTSHRSYKPRWRKIIPADWKEGVTNQEYWEQSSSYAELAVIAAGYDVARLSILIDHFGHLPEPAFTQLLHVLETQPISVLSEEQRLPIWNCLVKCVNKHRRYSDANWALPDEAIIRIEKAAELLAPKNPFYLNQHLFSGRNLDLYEAKGDWEKQQQKLDERRDRAIKEIFQQDGIDGVIRFAESVSLPAPAGHALGVIEDPAIESTILPLFLDASDNKLITLARGFIQRRYALKGWEWCDGIEKSNWTPAQIGHFLACLPCAKIVWERAAQWSQAHEKEYWIRVDTTRGWALTDDDFAIAIDKLIQYGRPHAAIDCLSMRYFAKKQIEPNQCTQGLLSALSSSEPNYIKDGYNIVQLIKFLQSEPSVNQKDLLQIEWAYVSLLDGFSGVTPKLLESELAANPEFFCKILRLAFRSTKVKDSPREPTKEDNTNATNAWQLLNLWKIPPGTQNDGTFSGKKFKEWLDTVKISCAESGHLEIALFTVGEVLIHTLPDPEGLWIHRVVASALNDRDADAIRRGFSIGEQNVRDVYVVDPTGASEKKLTEQYRRKVVNPTGASKKKLAEQYRRKAEDVENAGFHRFATTLKELANRYDREAERTISEQKQGN